MFVPIDTMPGWPQGFAEYSPVSVTADAARNLALGGPVRDTAVQSIAWSVAITTVFGGLAVWRSRRLG